MTGMKAGNQAENMSDANLGLYFLAAQDVFQLAEDPQYKDISIKCGLFEIYGGKLLDLLNNRNPIRCLEDSKGKVCFPGLSEHPVSNPEDLMDIIEAGSLNRSTGQTQANADSSRSHAVLQLSLRKEVGRSRRNIECGKTVHLQNLVQFFLFSSTQFNSLCLAILLDRSSNVYRPGRLGAWSRYCQRMSHNSDGGLRDQQISPCVEGSDSGSRHRRLNETYPLPRQQADSSTERRICWKELPYSNGDLCCT